MYIIIIAIIIALVISFIIAALNNEPIRDYGLRPREFSDRIFNFLGLGFVLVVFLGLTGYLTALFLGNYVFPTERTIKYNVELVALGNRTSTEGKLFLGTGTINGVMVYNYMYRLSDTASAYGYTNAKDSIVVEDEPNHPALRKYYYKIKGYYENWGLNSIEDSWEYHIPLGSIDRTFNINMGR